MPAKCSSSRISNGGGVRRRCRNRAALEAHVAALVADKSRVQPVTLEPTSWKARTSLRQASLPVLMYSSLKLGMPATRAAIHLDKEIGLGGDSVLVRKSGKPLSEPFPGCTRGGVRRDRDDRQVRGGQRFLGDSWVLGEGVASMADIPRLAGDMMRLYEDDYIHAWDALLADMVPRPTRSAPSWPT